MLNHKFSHLYVFTAAQSTFINLIHCRCNSLPHTSFPTYHSWPGAWSCLHLPSLLLMHIMLFLYYCYLDIIVLLLQAPKYYLYCGVNCLTPLQPFMTLHAASHDIVACAHKPCQLVELKQHTSYWFVVIWNHHWLRNFGKKRVVGQWFGCQLYIHTFSEPLNLFLGSQRLEPKLKPWAQGGYQLWACTNTLQGAHTHGNTLAFSLLTQEGNQVILSSPGDYQSSQYYIQVHGWCFCIITEHNDINFNG